MSSCNIFLVLFSLWNYIFIQSYNTHFRAMYPVWTKEFDYLSKSYSWLCCWHCHDTMTSNLDKIYKNFGGLILISSYFQIFNIFVMSTNFREILYKISSVSIKFQKEFWNFKTSLWTLTMTRIDSETKIETLHETLLCGLLYVYP